MSGAPLVAWITRGVRAQVEAIAQREGVPVEEVAGDLIASEVRRRCLPEPALPDPSQPSRAEHRQALREAGADAMASFGRPAHWRPERAVNPPSPGVSPDPFTQAAVADAISDPAILDALARLAGA